MNYVVILLIVTHNAFIPNVFSNLYFPFCFSFFFCGMYCPSLGTICTSCIFISRMLKYIRNVNFASGKKISTEPQLTIQKLLLAPFTMFTLGDFECIGKILGATISYFEGYSSDDIISNIEIKSNVDGSYVAKSNLTLVSQPVSKSPPYRSSTIKQVTITSVILPQPKDLKTDIRHSFEAGVLEGHNEVEKKFYCTSTRNEAVDLIKIYREAGITVSTDAFNTFLANMKGVDKTLCDEWEQEFEYELDLTQKILSSWRKVNEKKNVVAFRKSNRGSRLEKIRKLK